MILDNKQINVKKIKKLYKEKTIFFYSAIILLI